MENEIVNQCDTSAGDEFAEAVDILTMRLTRLF